MSEYNQIVVFGNVTFSLRNVIPSSQPSTIKQKIGKTFVEKRIPLRNAKDLILEIEGVIQGTSSGNIETDRGALDALEDGDSQTGTLKLTAESDAISGTAFYVTAYAQQGFFDTDGTPVMIGYVDADGTDKTENSFAYAFLTTT